MANPPPGSTGSGWQVVSQIETTELDQSGRPARGFRVGYTTDRGVSGSVFVPLAQLTPDNVRAAIMDQVARQHAIADLHG